MSTPLKNTARLDLKRVLEFTGSLVSVEVKEKYGAFPMKPY